MERVVFLYHHIAPGSSNNRQISPEDLRTQVVWLLEMGFEILPLQQFFTKQDALRRAFLTFDDGYEDIYSYAFPILQALNVPASVFLITDYIGKANSWDHKTVPCCKHLNHAQISELCKNQWEIHSHTASHTDFRKLSNSAIENDVQRATEAIRCWNPGPVFCAFPYGRSEFRLIHALQKHNYAGAFVAEPSWPDTDLFRLPRLAVTIESFERFKSSYMERTL